MNMHFSFRKFIPNLLFFFFSLLIAQTGISQILEPVKWSYEARILNDKEAELVFTATIDETWHLYSQDLPPGGPVKTSFNFVSLEGFRFVDKDVKIEEFEGWDEGSNYYSVVFNEPKAKEEFDPNFDMVVKYFGKKVEFTRKIELTTDKPLTISGYLEFMCCDDSKCLPPSEVDFEFTFNQSEQAGAPPSAPSSGSSVIADGQIGDDTTLLWLFIFSFIAGLLAILTPCVFPMIPMTVTFFMNNSENKVKAKFQAITYGLSIIVIYTVVGTVVAVTLGANFANWLSTHWLPNILFFLIFTFFAASFLGMFEITLPSWMISKTDSKADQGGFSGAFFMAFTLVLVSFSCTGPIVGAILVKSAGGQVLEPIVGMFGFSLAFALPFTLFAFFPSWLANLPKSGGWLNSVKVILGFLELALGLKFLSIADQTYHWGILDREVYLAFWIIIFALMGFYLLGKLKFAHDSDLPYIGVPRLILAILTFTFVIYMVPGMFGAPLKALSGYLPPQQTQDFDINAIVRDNLKIYSGGNIGATQSAKREICGKSKYSDRLHLPHGLEGYFDFEQGMACAKELNKPVFIDFTGHGCVNCREMEANVWSDPKVLQLLRDEFVIIALYVDDKSRLPEEDWVVSTHDGKMKKTIGKKYADFQISRFNVNAQPYYVLMDTNENILIPPRSYDLNVNAFIDFLNNGIEEFNKRK
jgi:thiol:disulfide interchange protein